MLTVKIRSIYLDRATRTLVKRIDGLPATVHSLAFSSDGGRLAITWLTACTFTPGSATGTKLARDDEYQDQSYGADLHSTAGSPPRPLTARFVFTRPASRAGFVPP